MRSNPPKRIVMVCREAFVLIWNRLQERFLSSKEKACSLVWSSIGVIDQWLLKNVAKYLALIYPLNWARKKERQGCRSIVTGAQTPWGNRRTAFAGKLRMVLPALQAA